MVDERPLTPLFIEEAHLVMFQQDYKDVKLHITTKLKKGIAIEYEVTDIESISYELWQCMNATKEIDEIISDFLTNEETTDKLNRLPLAYHGAAIALHRMVWHDADIIEDDMVVLER